MVFKALPILLAATAALSACSPAPASLPKGAHYVAMGSSFASGPGIDPQATDGPKRCGQSENNYARLLATQLGLDLSDMTCSGARTTHILGPWKELPSQLSAVREDTKLVTITIGGNDIGYIGGLMASSCAFTKARDGHDRKCFTAPSPTDVDYQGTQERLASIARDIKTKAPQARVVFVNYAAVLPLQGTCAQVPLPEGAAARYHDIRARLEAITAAAAEQTGSDVFSASDLTSAHNACAAEPWMTGYDANWSFDGAIPYHPTKEGMAAIAGGLADLLASGG